MHCHENGADKSCWPALPWRSRQPSPASGDLTITSQQTAKVCDQISISGVAAVNRDFGSGYLYPLLIEEATITAQ